MLNLKARLKNKTFLITFLITLVGLIYNILGILKIVPPVSEDSVKSIVISIVHMLALLGIFVDPTTQGICDSETERISENDTENKLG